MREILLEAKRLDNGEWVQGNLLTYGNKAYIVADEDVTGFEEEILSRIYWKVIENRFEVNPATVGQYTGLTDKNGTKIFEGDILKVAINETAKDEKGNQYWTGNKKFVYWSVEWVNFMTYLGWRVYGTNRRFNTNLSYSLLVNCPAEVIGNIYDNPELLKGGAADEK